MFLYSKPACRLFLLSLSLFSTRAQLKCFYYPVLETGGGKKYRRYHQPPSHFEICYLQSCSWCRCIFNIIKEKYIEKMKPSECERALKYIICKGKNGCSIIPKKRCKKPAAVTKSQPKYFTNHTNKGTIYICTMKCNRK